MGALCISISIHFPILFPLFKDQLLQCSHDERNKLGKLCSFSMSKFSVTSIGIFICAFFAMKFFYARGLIRKL